MVNIYHHLRVYGFKGTNELSEVILYTLHLVQVVPLHRACIGHRTICRTYKVT